MSAISTIVTVIGWIIALYGGINIALQVINSNFGLLVVAVAMVAVGIAIVNRKKYFHVDF